MSLLFISNGKVPLTVGELENVIFIFSFFTLVVSTKHRGAVNPLCHSVLFLNLFFVNQNYRKGFKE